MQRPKNISKGAYSYYLYSGISSDTVKPLIELLKDVKFGTTLNLYINSKGGVVPVAIGVYNFIKSVKGLKVNTYNMGHCDSAATLLFMLGNRRYVSPKATFYMHSLRVTLQHSQTVTTLKSELLNLKEDTRMFISLLAESSRISQKQWKTWMSDKGTLIKAKKAILLGIANDTLEKENTIWN